jgi:SAM-dependent methyltransferase
VPSWDWGTLRRLEPVSRVFGFDRGLPVDRYYIEEFLSRWARDIAGRTLEIGDDAYTRRYGGDRATHRDVLHVHDRNPAATIVGDLVSAPHIPDETFDCLVLTQTLHLIYDLDAAVRTIYRILRPGAVVLATFPGISQLSVDDWRATWGWGLSCRLAEQIFGRHFDKANIAVHRYGNSLAAACFLHGLAADELSRERLDAPDRDCELLIGVRAVK